MKRSKSNQSVDENDSKAIQFAEQSIMALIREPFAQTIEASCEALYMLHNSSQPKANRFVFDEAKVLSTLQFQESAKAFTLIKSLKDVECINLDLSMSNIIFLQIQQKINRFFKKRNITNLIDNQSFKIRLFLLNILITK